MRVIRRDLFSMPDEYYLAHCISSDKQMGAGIAVSFQRKFNVRQQLPHNITYPACYITGRVCNLVTKERYWHKPTIDSLTHSLYEMKGKIYQGEKLKIAMPKIGCGLDRLKWSEVSSVIEEVFDKVCEDLIICTL